MTELTLYNDMKGNTLTISSSILSEQDNLYKDNEVGKQESVKVTATYFDILNESKRWNNHGQMGSLEMLKTALKDYVPKLRATVNIKNIKDINDWVDKYAVDEGNHFELVSKIADKLFIVE